MAAVRGEVYWADLSPVVGSEQGGMRPVVIVQADPVNRHASTTLVLSVTSRPQATGYPLTVALEPGEGGVSRPSWIKVSQVRTVSPRRLRGRLGALGGARMAEVDRALARVLRLDGVRG